MKKSNKLSPEVRERAVRMVFEHHGEYSSLWATIESIAPKIGCVPRPCMIGSVNTRSTLACAMALPAAERDRVKALSVKFGSSKKCD
jgi:transposase-like protein